MLLRSKLGEQCSTLVSCLSIYKKVLTSFCIMNACDCNSVTPILIVHTPGKCTWFNVRRLRWITTFVSISLTVLLVGSCVINCILWQAFKGKWNLHIKKSTIVFTPPSNDSSKRGGLCKTQSHVKFTRKSQGLKFSFKLVYKIYNSNFF